MSQTESEVMWQLYKDMKKTTGERNTLLLVDMMEAKEGFYMTKEIWDKLLTENGNTFIIAQNILKTLIALIDNVKFDYNSPLFAGLTKKKNISNQKLKSSLRIRKNIKYSKLINLNSNKKTSKKK